MRSRRTVLAQLLKTATAVGLLQLLQVDRALALGVDHEIQSWARRVDTICRDLRVQTLSAGEWQLEVERLMRSVALEDLLKAIDFDRLEALLNYPELGVDTQRVRFRDDNGASEFGFVAKLFGMNPDRAIIPHGHRNMVSAHTVLGGKFHLRQYERLEREGDSLIVRPTVDEHVGAGHASSISDERNNIHWLIARGGRSYTLDVIVVGLDAEQPSYEIENLDADRATPLGDEKLRMPIIGVEEALSRYGQSHHQDSEREVTPAAKRA